MRELLEHSPDDFCAAAVEILGGEASERMQRFLLALLGNSGMLIKYLTDSSTPLEKAESIAALARRFDSQMPATLVDFVLERAESESAECVQRILNLLRSMRDIAGIRPLMTRLLRHPDARIRSKVALMAGEGNQNRMWFERRMAEDDPRVRANLIESAGVAVAKDLMPLFRSAVSDSNNRVVGNALIALYRLGDAGSIAQLHEMISRTEDSFRATAVWVMGETGDTRFLPLLTKILIDPKETIKAVTFRAIRKLRAKESGQMLPLDVRILGDPTFSGPELKVDFAVSNGHGHVAGMTPTAIRILVNGCLMYRYSVSEQECNGSLKATFLVPQTLEEIHRDALGRCFEQKHDGDSWVVSRYSVIIAEQPARPETRLRRSGRCK